MKTKYYIAIRNGGNGNFYDIDTIAETPEHTRGKANLIDLNTGKRWSDRNQVIRITRIELKEIG